MTITQLHQNSRKKKRWRVCVPWNGEDERLYSSGGENMNGMAFNKS